MLSAFLLQLTIFVGKINFILLLEKRSIENEGGATDASEGRNEKRENDGKSDGRKRGMTDGRKDGARRKEELS